VKGCNQQGADVQLLIDSNACTLHYIGPLRGLFFYECIKFLGRAARWLEPHLAPGDVVFSDQHMVLAHYLPGKRVQQLRPNPASLTASVRGLQQSGRGEAVWIVAPAPSHAFRTNLKAGGLLDWIYDNCQVRSTLGVGRVDFRQQYLQIYRCPAAVPAGFTRSGSLPAVSDSAASTPGPGRSR